MTASARTKIILALISASATIGVAYFEHSRNGTTASSETHNPTTRLVVAGQVIDEATSSGVSAAEITIVGRPEFYTTEDSGNFSIVLPKDLPDVPLRIKVSKPGYATADRSVTPPANEIVIALRKGH